MLYFILVRFMAIRRHRHRHRSMDTLDMDTLDMDTLGMDTLHIIDEKQLSRLFFFCLNRNF